MAEDLHRPIIRKFKKRKVYSSFKDNVWSVDIADMHLITKNDKEFHYLLCVINIYSKCSWAALLEEKKSITITEASQET